MNPTAHRSIDDSVSIFRGSERTLIATAAKHSSEAEVQRRLKQYRLTEPRVATDDEYFAMLVDITSYSGFRSDTVIAKLDVIRQCFPGFREVAAHGMADVERMLANPQMIRNRRKIDSCIKNAREIRSIVDQYGSVQAWLDSTRHSASVESLMSFREELQRRFSGLGPITSFHFMTDCGLPVLKPDRVVCRVLYRLGFIEDEGRIIDAVIAGRMLAEVTGEPIRYVDIVLVAYGQVGSEWLGLPKGICLSDKPLCHMCGVVGYCRYDRKGLGGGDFL